MEQLQKFSDVYNAYLEEHNIAGHQGSAPDELPKERRRFCAFLYSLGVQPESFKYPVSLHNKNKSYARFFFNEDGINFLMQYFRQRNSELYKAIRRGKFFSTYYKEYENMSKQIASNMRSLGHNKNSIQTQIDKIWLTVTRNHFFDFLPGFQMIAPANIIDKYRGIMDDAVLVDLFHISRVIEEDYRIFQEVWRLRLMIFLHSRDEERKDIENRSWFKALENDLKRIK